MFLRLERVKYIKIRTVNYNVNKLTVKNIAQLRNFVRFKDVKVIKKVFLKNLSFFNNFSGSKRSQIHHVIFGFQFIVSNN